MANVDKQGNKTVSTVFIVSINSMAIQPYSNLKAAFGHFQSIVLATAPTCLSYSAVNRRLNKTKSYSYVAPNAIQYSIAVFDLLISFDNSLK